MSKADNHVKWCLNKAKKELSESNNHRGLIKIESDLDKAKKHIVIVNE